MSILNWFFKKKKQPRGIITCYSGKVVAKILYGGTTDSYMYIDQKVRPDSCPICHNKLNLVPNLLIKVHSKDDLSSTYDGYHVISEKFYNFCKEGGYKNLRIIPLEKSKGFYFFEPMDVFGLDYEFCRTKFIDKRDCCGSYDEVIRPPVIKAKNYKIESNDFIMKAEYYFGSYSYKSNVIIVGTETAKKMNAYGLKGLFFDKIYDHKNLKVIKKETDGIVLD